MLDTVKIQLSNYRIRNNAALTINRGNFSVATGVVQEVPLYTDTQGTTLYGKNAWYNSEDKKLKVDLSYFSGSIYLSAEFSIPKQVRDNNYRPIAANELKQAFQRVENELAEVGIETDISQAKLSRLDTFRNIETNEETASYGRLFGLLQAKRTTDKNTYGATTWLMKNTQRQYCIYDKLEEMKNRNESVETFPNTLRFEHRCLSRRVVGSFLELEKPTVEELEKYSWQELQEKSTAAWLDNFFRYDIPNIETMAESEMRAEMQFFQEKFGRNWLSQYLKAYGAYHLAKTAGGIDVFIKALDNLEANRMQINRTKKVLEQVILTVEGLRLDTNSPKTLGALYEELKTKMIASG